MIMRITRNLRKYTWESHVIVLRKMIVCYDVKIIIDVSKIIGLRSHFRYDFRILTFIICRN